MNPEAQIIAIAEARGWTSVRRCEMRQPNGEMKVVGIWGEAPEPCATQPWVPDYLKDLNLWHEIEAAMLPGEAYGYQAALSDELGGWKPSNGARNWLWHASAEQRSKAWLKMIGKWTDEPANKPQGAATEGGP